MIKHLRIQTTLFPRCCSFGLYVQRENVPHLWVHLGSFELFNLMKQQRIFTHPKLPTFFGWIFFQENTRTTFEQTSRTLCIWHWTKSNLWSKWMDGKSIIQCEKLFIYINEWVKFYFIYNLHLWGSNGFVRP
jgi:hypothetical protein